MLSFCLQLAHLIWSSKMAAHRDAFDTDLGDAKHGTWINQADLEDTKHGTQINQTKFETPIGSAIRQSFFRQPSSMNPTTARLCHVS